MVGLQRDEGGWERIMGHSFCHLQGSYYSEFLPGHRNLTATEHQFPEHPVAAYEMINSMQKQ